MASATTRASTVRLILSNHFQGGAQHSVDQCKEFRAIGGYEIGGILQRRVHPWLTQSGGDCDLGLPQRLRALADQDDSAQMLGLSLDTSGRGTAAVVIGLREDAAQLPTLAALAFDPVPTPVQLPQKVCASAERHATLEGATCAHSLPPCCAIRALGSLGG